MQSIVRVDSASFVFRGGQLLLNAGKVTTMEEGKTMLDEKLKDGSALQKFHDMLLAQGTAMEVADALCDADADIFTILPRAENQTEIIALHTGLVSTAAAITISHWQGFEFRSS